MRRRFSLIVLLLATAGAAAALEPPNVLLIVADDLGWADVGYHGSEIRTPNIDGLAAKGVALERFYAYPVCSPTRAALMTGRSAVSLGIVSPISGEEQGGLALDERLLPEVFRDAGYQTFITGKWHLGLSRVDYFPQNRGFDHFYGSLGGFLDYYDHIFSGGLDWQRDGVSVREEGYATNLTTAEAIRLLRARDKKKPTFLYLSYNAPHSPLEALDVFVEKYSGVEPEPRRIYSAMVDAMDAGIGRVLAAVAEEGMTENTLVMFLSDNGAARVGDNGPLRGGKGTVFEGGVRTPAALWWPGVVEGGREVHEFVTVHDVLPTLAAAAGIPIGETKPLYGENRWPVIRDGQAAGHGDFVLGARGNLALYSGEWKLVRENLPDGFATSLFRVMDDSGEKQDLAAQYPEVVAELSAKLDAHPKGDPVGGAAVLRPRARRGPRAGGRPPGERGVRAPSGQPGRRGPRGPGGQRGGRLGSDWAGGPETREPYAEAAARD